MMLAENTVDQLRRDGVTWLPRLLDTMTLANIRAEYERIWLHGNGLRDVIAEPYLTTRMVTSSWLREHRCFALHDLGREPLFQEIAAQWFDEPHNPLVKMYATRSRGPSGERIPYWPHFDEVEFLKFFVYLTDCGPGAIEAKPGTHTENRRRREQAMAHGVPWDRMNTRVDDHPLTRIEAPAGTVVIFTTDVSHCAGALQADESREAFQYLAARQSVLDWRGYQEEDVDR